VESATPKNNSWWTPIVILGLIAGIIFAAGAFWLRRFSAAIKQPVIYADAGFKRATNTIDPEALRAWALENVRQKASTRDVAATMPASIRNLYDEPPEVQIDEKCLTLSWGGGHFHWVLYIGDTNLTLPFVSDNQGYPYNFEWRPGIYYTREAGPKLQ